MAKSSKGKDQTALKKKATAVAAQRGNKKKKRGSMKEYFKGVKLEMKKVVWPTPKQLATNTGVALFVMALAAVVLWGFDELAGLVVNVIFELAG